VQKPHSPTPPGVVCHSWRRLCRRGREERQRLRLRFISVRDRGEWYHLHPNPGPSSIAASPSFNCGTFLIRPAPFSRTWTIWTLRQLLRSWGRVPLPPPHPPLPLRLRRHHRPCKLKNLLLLLLLGSAASTDGQRQWWHRQDHLMSRARLKEDRGSASVAFFQMGPLASLNRHLRQSGSTDGQLRRRHRMALASTTSYLHSCARALLQCKWVRSRVGPCGKRDGIVEAHLGVG